MTKDLLNQALQQYIDINFFKNNELINDNIILTLHNNMYKLQKSVNHKSYIICQFDDYSLKINEYIKWQLNYALLAH